MILGSKKGGDKMNSISDESTGIQRSRMQKKKIITLALIFLVIFIATVVFLFAKAGFVLNQVSTGGGLIDSLTQMVSGDGTLEGEEEGRINVLLLGMRGEELTGGGLLADTIMVASIDPINKKASLFSIPRDLYVTVPERGFKSKINAVYHYGEENNARKGMQNMKTVVGEIVGEEIHYTAVINFQGFVDLVNSIGGVTVHLDEPFVEPLQFREEHVCDDKVFTVPSGNSEIKKNEKGKIVAQYPLCYNKDLECGGVFELPAGDVNLDGEKALCYVRSRVTTSDFDRTRRQQEVLKQIKEKAMSAGTLSDFGKVNKMLDTLGKNTKTDMRVWEIKMFFEMYQEMSDMTIKQKVLENSEEGLLYAPEDADPSAGYILLPRGGNYSRIQKAFKEVLDKDKMETETTIKQQQ